MNGARDSDDRRERDGAGEPVVSRGRDPGARTERYAATDPRVSHERGTLLVVDDNEMNRDMLSRRLGRMGYAVSLAEGGARALELIATGRFDLVLLDVMMPEVDGFTVLERVRETRSVADLPVIMATARDRTEDVVRALDLGANDYVTKPLDFPVVLARVRTQLALKRAKQALEAANRRMKSDLDAAARVQRALIPTVPPAAPGVEFAWRFEPCDELAGDILDVFRLDDRSVGLYLLDVSGHGVPAALLAVTLSRVLSHMADDSLLLRPAGEGAAPGGSRVVPPARVAAMLNQRFPMDETTGQYFTLLYGVLDLDSRELRTVCAGHPRPVRLGRGRDPEVIEAAGVPIGWLPGFEYEESRVSLAPGDRIYFYSDGVIEARNPRSEFYTTERLVRTLAESRDLRLEESLGALMASLAGWREGGRPDDDVSLIALEIERH